MVYGQYLGFEKAGKPKKSVSKNTNKSSDKVSSAKTQASTRRNW